MELMFQPLKKYADFNGRARRSEYWLWQLFLFGVGIVFAIIQQVALGGAAATMANHAADAADVMQMGGPFLILMVIRLVFALAVLIPSIAVSVRRMHDTNRTGWWIVFPTVVFFAALIIYAVVDGANFMTAMQNIHAINKDSNDPSAAFAILGTLGKAMLWVFLPTFVAKIVTFVFRVLDGTSGPNRYGQDPKGPNANVF
jgi:uncharacterized membrane protein YhaH (DUF805 family)